MKKFALLITVVAALAACNNNSDNKDSVEKADSANEVKQDQAPAAMQTDAATTDFLVKAADGGLAEVAAGQTAQQKAMNARVKDFASMMVSDHTGANGTVKTLAAARNVTLPSEPSQEHKDNAAKVAEKTGKDFDKAYMKMMVDDHEKTIKLFEKGRDDSKDEEVKTFITNTIPKLQQHLDSARAIQKSL